MPNTLRAAPSADEWATPDHWTGTARDVFLEIVDARPDLAGADLAAAEQAASLIDAAERLDVVARDAAMVATGSAGQEILHPAIAEARQARAAAATILARLAVPAASSMLSNSDRGRLAARARWARAGSAS